MTFIRTTAINKILAMKARKKVIQGGSSAGKTFGVLPILINDCCVFPNKEISVVAESVPHLKKGALKDFIKIMKATNRWNDNRYNATDRKYTFANGSYMEFFSPESIIGSRRTDLYINEAPFIKYEDYYQMAIRTSGNIYLDFNPFNEFWAHTEVLKESDAEMLLLTYEDNEALPPNVISDFQQAILKAEREIKEGKEGYWCNWVKVYVKGQIGNLQGAIFNNWEQVNVDVSKMTPKAYVIDWGFSKDPLAMLAVYEYNGGLLFDELIYDTGLTNSALVTRLNELKIDKTIPIICDSSEPKSIKELRDAVFIAEAADKGGDSVITSIKKMQEFTLFITQGSVNVIKELRRYVWADNKTKDVPIDRDNHAVDAMRYYVLNRIIKKVYYDAY